jgi:tripartite-type tricarboxylate transporter receptor subunit TctC
VIRIQRDIAQAILAQDMHERWSAWGYEPVGSTPEEFTEKYKLDLATYARVIRDAKIPLQE